MKYKILVKTFDHYNMPMLKWYTTNKKEWESSSLDDAIKEYGRLLSSHSASCLTLVKIVDVDVLVKLHEIDMQETDTSEAEYE